MKKHNHNFGKSRYRRYEQRLMRRESNQETTRSIQIATKLKKAQELLTPKKIIKTEADPNFQSQISGIITSVARIGIGKFNGNKFLVLMTLLSLPVVRGESDLNTINPASNPIHEVASTVSVIASAVAFSVPIIIYMSRSQIIKELYNTVTKINGSSTQYQTQIDDPEQAIDNELPQTASEQFGKLMKVIEYLLNKSTPIDDSRLGSIKKLIFEEENLAELKQKLSNVISADNLAVVIVAYEYSKSGFKVTNRDEKTIETLDLILLKLAQSYGLKELSKKPQTHQGHAEIASNVEQIGVLFKQFQEQPWVIRKAVIKIVSIMYPLGCSFAAIPGLFRLAIPNEGTNPIYTEVARPFYALLISIALISAHSANNQYVEGLQSSLMRFTDDIMRFAEDISIKTAVKFLMYCVCCLLAIAASSIGSATQDLAGDKVCTSVGNFFTGEDLTQYCTNSSWNSFPVLVGIVLACTSFGVTPMTYCDVWDLGKGISRLHWKETPKSLYKFIKEHYFFAAAFPFFQAAAQGQTMGYSLTAFLKFKTYLGESGANVAFLVATTARIALVSRSSLLSQRRLDSAIHEMDNYFEKQIDNLIKVFLILEEKDFDQNKKIALKKKLAEAFNLNSDDELLKQLEARRSDPELKEYIKIRGGIKNILQKAQEEMKIDEFKPSDCYQALTEFQYSQILPWIALFANGIANFATVSKILPIPEIFGGGDLPDVFRDYSAVATAFVSIAICSRYLGLKTRQEREKMKKYVDGLIGDEHVRFNMISGIMFGDKQEVISVDDNLQRIEMMKPCPEGPELTRENTYDKLVQEEKNLVEDYISSKATDSEVRSEREKLNTRNGVVRRLIDDNEEEMNAFKNFLAEKNQPAKFNEIIEKLRGVQVGCGDGVFSKALSELRESPSMPSITPKPRGVLGLADLSLGD